MEANGVMFRAPEQLFESFPECDKGVDDSDTVIGSAVDVYALGVIAAHLWLVHSLPKFSPKTIRAICAGHRPEQIDKLPTDVGGLVTACVQRDSRDRPSMHEVDVQLKSTPSLFVIE